MAEYGACGPSEAACPSAFWDLACSACLPRNRSFVLYTSPHKKIEKRKRSQSNIGFDAGFGAGFGVAGRPPAYQKRTRAQVHSVKLCCICDAVTCSTSVFKPPDHAGMAPDVTCWVRITGASGANDCCQSSGGRHWSLKLLHAFFPASHCTVYVSVYCVCLLRLFTATVYCVCLLRC